jgi:hypothetical protein
MEGFCSPSKGGGEKSGLSPQLANIQQRLKPKALEPLFLNLVLFLRFAG